jgi:hypothetical protein
MFDVARLIALTWALVVVLRARARLEAISLAVVGYFFALALVSGFTIRREGPLDPMFGLLLALIGPTSIPRGALPSLPGARLVVAHPAVVNVLACAALVALAWRLASRAYRLPAASLETSRLDRLGRALVLVAAFEGISAATRILPSMLDWGWGGSDPIFEGAPAIAPK